MPVNVFPAPSTSSSLTPFDAPFSYTWGTSREGVSITLDLTNSVPAGTYTAAITHTAPSTNAPAKVEFLSANDTVVASTTTITTVSTSSITAVLAPTSSFTKIRLSGTSRGSTVVVGSASTISLSIGTRTVSVINYWDKMKTANNIIRHTNHPTTLPDATFIWGNAAWYFNNKLYYLMSDRDQNAFASDTGTSNFRVYAWDYTNGTWSSNLGTNISATSIFSTNYKFYGSWQWSVFTFKNGNVLLRPQYLTVNNSTFQQTNKALFFNLSGNSTSIITFSDSTHAAIASVGASCYNSVNDEWYITGGSVYSSANGSWVEGNGLVRFSNNGTFSNRTTPDSFTSSYAEDFQLFVENVASPKMQLIYPDTGNNLYGVFYPSFAGTAVKSAVGSASASGASADGYPMTSLHRGKYCIPASIGGTDGYIYAPDTNEPRGMFGPITTFDQGSFSSGSNFSSLPVLANKNNWVVQPSEGEANDGTTVYQLGPINSTTLAAVKFNRNTDGVYGTIAMPFPSPVTF
jgi:hypothetical protein